MRVRFREVILTGANGRGCVTDEPSWRTGLFHFQIGLVHEQKPRVCLRNASSSLVEVNQCKLL